MNLVTDENFVILIIILIFFLKHCGRINDGYFLNKENFTSNDGEIWLYFKDKDEHMTEKIQLLHLL